MQVGDLVKRKGWGAYQELYDKEPHLGILIDNMGGHQLVDVYWFRDNKNILTTRHVVEVVSECTTE